jgi:hypothetical protein
MQHIVARKMAEQQIIQLQNGQLAIERRMVEMMASFNSKIENLIELMQKQPDKMDKCKVDLREEIDKDFPSKIDLERMEAHLKTQISALNTKVDMQWLKITIPVSVVVAASSIVGWFITYGMIVSKMAGQ